LENGMVLARGGRVSIARISQGKEKKIVIFSFFWFSVCSQKDRRMIRDLSFILGL
jgi:hypothetical protein